MRKTHLILGAVFFALFLISGRYMGQVLPEFTGELDGTRMMYRASHVYLLYASLLNLLAGAADQDNDPITIVTYTVGTGAPTPAGTPVAIVQNASLPLQRQAVCRLDRLAATIEREQLHSPSVIVVGDVMGGLLALQSQPAMTARLA